MINFNIEKIVGECEQFGVSLDDKAVARLNQYGNLLLEWNEKINLTAITEPEEVLYKHFYDCILFLKHTQIAEGACVIDVGTGAGFPGVVLKIARPDIKLTLLDSLNKRLVFLNEVLDNLSLEAQTVHARAEEAGRNPLFRGKYDIACARAVSGLSALLEYCMPFVKVGGQFVAMKGGSAAEELAASKNAIKALGASQGTIICETLTGNEQRAFVNFKKISQTPAKYPRMSVKISKHPL